MRLLTLGIHERSVAHLQCRYSVDVAEDEEDAISLIRFGNYDACVAHLNYADKMFPFHVRSCGLKIPLIIMTVGNRKREDEHSIRAGMLNNGADACIDSSWHDEMIANINAVIRRSHGYTSKLLDFNGLVVDIDAKIVMVNGHDIEMTGSEYTIVEAIAISSPAVATKDYLYDCLYPTEGGKIKTVDVFMCKVRKKIKEFSDFMYIETVWGRGYIMVKND